MELKFTWKSFPGFTMAVECLDLNGGKTSLLELFVKVMPVMFTN